MSMVIPLASRRAAPSLPATGATTDPHQAFADAHNALRMALYYLGDASPNVPASMRKAAQALAALRRLDALVQGGDV